MPTSVKKIVAARSVVDQRTCIVKVVVPQELHRLSSGPFPVTICAAAETGEGHGVVQPGAAAAAVLSGSVLPGVAAAAALLRAVPAQLRMEQRLCVTW